MSRFGAFAKRERYHTYKWEGIHAIVSTTSCILRQAAFLALLAFGQAPANHQKKKSRRPSVHDARAVWVACMAAIALLVARSRSPAAMHATALAVSGPCSARAGSAAAPARQALPACPPRSAFHGASLAAPSGRQQLAAACSRPSRPAAASGLRVYAAAKAPWEGKPTAR